MSQYDYEKSRQLSIFPGVTFYALIMAAMRHADTENTEKLRDAFPETWDLIARLYKQPGALHVDAERPSLAHCAEATLLFYSLPPWDEPKKARWFTLTGNEEATTKVLCDLCRRGLDSQRAAPITAIQDMDRLPLE